LEEKQKNNRAAAPILMIDRYIFCLLVSWVLVLVGWLPWAAVAVSLCSVSPFLLCAASCGLLSPPLPSPRPRVPRPLPAPPPPLPRACRSPGVSHCQAAPLQA
jgi:hypothetical protein